MLHAGLLDTRDIIRACFLSGMKQTRDVTNLTSFKGDYIVLTISEQRLKLAFCIGITNETGFSSTLSLRASHTAKSCLHKLVPGALIIDGD